jgi:hypothetical protein
MEELPLANSKAVCVLGMHRSGTSVVSRIVNLLGAYLGEANQLQSPGDDNPEGFWEHTDIVCANDKLLEALHQRWDSPLPLKKGWNQSVDVEPFQKDFNRIVSKIFRGQPIWAWKDPRTCLLFPLWREVLNDVCVDLAVIFVARHPVDVAKSLLKRNNFPIQKSLGVWLNYNLSALKSLEGLPVVVVSYDKLLDETETQIRRISKSLTVTWQTDETDLKSELTDFIRYDLRHNKVTVGDSHDLPPLVKDLHDLMSLAAEDKIAVDKEYIAQIMKIADQYETSAETFRWDMERIFRDANVRDQQIQKRDQQIQKLDQQIQELDRRIEGKEKELVNLKNTYSWKVTEPLRRAAGILRDKK